MAYSGNLPEIRFPQGNNPISENDPCPTCGREAGDLCPRCAYWEDKYARHHHAGIEWHPHVKHDRTPHWVQYVLWRLTRNRKR